MARSGIKMIQRDLRDEESVVRQCSRQKQVVGEDGAILGVTADAFKLRVDIAEEYQSTAWLEYSNGTTDERLRQIVELWRSERSVRGNCAMVICNAGRIRVCGQRRSCNLRVRHEPKRTNKAYSTIRRLPYDNSDLELLELLAADAVVAIKLIREL